MSFAQIKCGNQEEMEETLHLFQHFGFCVWYSGAFGCYVSPVEVLSSKCLAFWCDVTKEPLPPRYLEYLERTFLCIANKLVPNESHC